MRPAHEHGGRRKIDPGADDSAASETYLARRAHNTVPGSTGVASEDLGPLAAWGVAGRGRARALPLDPGCGGT